MTKKKNNKQSTISFDNETVTKEEAEKILSENKDKHSLSRNENSVSEKDETAVAVANKHKRKRKKKNKKTEENKLEEVDGELRSREPEKKTKQKDLNEEANDELDSVEPRKKKKRKEKKRDTTDTDISEENQENSTADNPETKTSKTEGEKEESIRARKRKKHAQLLVDKKLKTELALQQKCLNYLSLWKHNRGEWKFEKLRQVWLQHNMFDAAKIPDEFWDDLVQYFGNSKGKARSVIIQDAVKLIEQEGSDDNDSDEFQIKLKRARDIVQNLQE